MPTSGGFHELLFEASNESRYEILVLLREKPMRNTDISRELKLTSPETRRQVSRLGEVGLIQRDLEGFYHLTPYGEMSLILFQEFHFISSNRDYFQTHTTTQVPTKFVKRIGELGGSSKIENPMDFLRHTESLFKESNEHVWLLVDQFPLNSLSTIMEAIERGVQFKIIEPVDRVLSPDIESMTSEETQALSRTRQTSLADQRMVDEVNVFLFLSENRCVIAFPTTEGQYDYRGFNSTDASTLKWCRELFQHYWLEAEPRTAIKTTLLSKIPQISDTLTSDEQIIVQGRNDPDIDAQAIQNAVDNYSEVILRGRFNLGVSRIATSGGATSLMVRRSVVIRGEGREDGVPATKIVKRGWKFPLHELNHLLVVDGEGIDVTIENIHFQDFNGYCISNQRGNSVKICKNRITLLHGFGRGYSYGQWGDQLVGIISGSGSPEEGGFPGGAVIEGNYLDFAESYTEGGFVFKKGLGDDPNYRPDLVNHEGYMGNGIVLNRNLGKVIVRDNVIRNMNARGIVAFDNYESADIRITGNVVVSGVYGSYPFSSHLAGVGIFAQSAWEHARSGTRVEISGNEIRCDKLNYCGIAVYGQSYYREGAGKLGECIVRDNEIHMGDGSVGVLIRKNDRTEVFGNKISGKAYYGFHLWGSRDREGVNLGSNENLIEDNDMADLVIKAPDAYSDSHVDGRMFTGSEGKSTTGHVWLNEFTAMNTIKLGADETVIDEGKNNTIQRG